jgi:hypothetical protein
MSQIDSARLPTVADFLPPEKTRQLVELFCAVIGRAAGLEVEVRDEAGGLLGVLRPSPDSDRNGDIHPALLEELRRRMENPEPPIPVEEVLAWLDAIIRGQDTPPA